MAYEQIIESVTAYLQMYGLLDAISFIYHDSIRDVDVLWPDLDSKMIDDYKEIETMINLMEKHSFSVPPEVLRRKHFLQKKVEQREAIKNFENWILGYFTYLDLDNLNIEAVYYSRSYGIMVKFYESKKVFKKKDGIEEPLILREWRHNKKSHR